MFYTPIHFTYASLIIRFLLTAFKVYLFLTGVTFLSLFILFLVTLFAETLPQTSEKSPLRITGFIFTDIASMYRTRIRMVEISQLYISTFRAVKQEYSEDTARSMVYLCSENIFDPGPGRNNIFHLCPF